MFHEIPLKVYLIKLFERNISQCILAFKARIHCEIFLSKNFMRYVVSLCKLLRNAYGILFEAFHEIWKFWKLIFRIFSSVKNFSMGSYKPCTRSYPPTSTHTHPHPSTTSQKKVTLTYTHPQRAIKRSHSPTITQISQKISHSPTSTHTQPKRSHSPTPTHTQAKKGLTHPHAPTPCQKRVTPIHT